MSPSSKCKTSNGSSRFPHNPQVRKLHGHDQQNLNSDAVFIVSGSSITSRWRSTQDRPSVKASRAQKTCTWAEIPRYTGSSTCIITGTTTQRYGVHRCALFLPNFYFHAWQPFSYFAIQIIPVKSKYKKIRFECDTTRNIQEMRLTRRKTVSISLVSQRKMHKQS